MKLARTQNTIRSVKVGFIYKFINIIMPFVIKTLLIREMGLEYAGLSSLFKSILSVLNMMELGVGSAMVYSMYQAVARDDNDAMCALLNLYKKVYRVMGLIILGAGLACMPFIDVLVKGECPSDLNLKLLFLMYLSETVISYLLFSYTNSVFNAYQQKNIIFSIEIAVTMLRSISQIVVILVWKNYYVYLACAIAAIAAGNLLRYALYRKKYPKIVCRGQLDKGQSRDIFRHVMSLFGHKLGGTVIISIDSMVISSFLGLRMMSLYSNYNYIVTSIVGFCDIIVTSMLAGLGNKIAVEKPEKTYDMFMSISYVWMWMIGWCAICLMALFQPFIGGIWLGGEYLLPDSVCIVVAVYFFSWRFRQTHLLWKDAAGLWSADKFKPYVGMALNLVFSIVLVRAMGSVVGVLYPTIAIMIFLYFPWEVHVLFSRIFHRSCKKYLLRVLKYVVLLAAGSVAVWWLSESLLPDNTILSFVGRFLICLTVPNVIFVLGTYRSEEFRWFKNRAMRILRRGRKSV